MALPKIETPTYELTLPSQDIQVKYRPFLVKEEKILLMAVETGGQKELVQAITDIVRACTFNKIEARKLPIFDLEYLFLQIRARSVGEIATLKILCPDDNLTYAVKLFDCYPKTIGAVEYSHAQSQEVQSFQVTFDFRYWINYFIDRAGNVELGQSNFRDATVKQAGGLFGGLLGKLPPELRRAGRGVIEDLRRRIPIGRATGGRVFPPFKIPPLNI